MKASAKTMAKPENEVEEEESLRKLKHDIKNQLSNILLAIEQLRYEIPDPTVDCIFYLDSISISSTKIDSILKGEE